MNFEDNELAIEPIDTTKAMRHTPQELLVAIKELQLKVNEIIDVVNILSLPDDLDALNDEDEDEDGTKIIGVPVQKKAKK